MPLPDLTRRRDLAGPLNADQFDGNIDNLDQRVGALEAVEPVFPIDDIIAAGNQLTFELSNSTSKSVTIPVPRYNPRIYTPGQPLAVYDVFPFNGSLWVAIWPHVMAAEFVADANDGLGHDYYFELLPNPGNSLPENGELGQVLFKLSGVNYAVGWRFLDSIYVTFSPSSDSDLTSNNVADALEELEALIATTAAGLAFAAIAISYSPSGASALVSDNVGDALDELGERVTDFADLSGTISPTQSRNPAVALGTVSDTVAIDPDAGEVFTITPNGAVTLDAASAADGAHVVVHVITSGTSSHNITFGANFKSTGVLATGTVSGKTFSISFDGNGANLVEACRTVAM